MTEGLRKEFPAGSRDLLGRKRLAVKAVDGVDLEIEPARRWVWWASPGPANRPSAG